VRFPHATRLDVLFSDHPKCLDLIFIFTWPDDFYRKSLTSEACPCADR
jgi:hypothetical protein